MQEQRYYALVRTSIFGPHNYCFSKVSKEQYYSMPRPCHTTEQFDGSLNNLINIWTQYQAFCKFSFNLNSPLGHIDDFQEWGLHSSCANPPMEENNSIEFLSSRPLHIWVPSLFPFGPPLILLHGSQIFSHEFSAVLFRTCIFPYKRH